MSREVLDAANADLARATDAVADLTNKRDVALLAGDMEATAAIERDLDAASNHARRCRDRIGLLERQAELTERRNQAKEIIALVGRLEQKLARRDQIAAELEKALAQVIRAFHHLADLGLEVTAAWPLVQTGDAIEAIVTPAALQRAVAAELYRLSGTPFVGGSVADPRTPPSFPGAEPINRITRQKDAPLSERMRAASGYAIGRMRSTLPPPADEKGAAA